MVGGETDRLPQLTHRLVGPAEPCEGHAEGVPGLGAVPVERERLPVGLEPAGQTAEAGNG